MQAPRQDLLRDEYLTLTIMILSPASVLRRQFPEFFETLKWQFESCLEGEGEFFLFFLPHTMAPHVQNWQSSALKKISVFSAQLLAQVLLVT